MRTDRARIGVIVLSTNLTVEAEFRQMLRDGVSFHVARCQIADTARNEAEKEASFLKMEGHLIEAARRVAMVKPDVILFACTIGSFLSNEIGELSIETKVTNETGIPSVTTSTAVVEAITALNLKNICLVSPYPQEMGIKEKKALERRVPGLRVGAMKHMGIMSSFEKNFISPAITERCAREIITPETDGLFISCTALPTLELIEPIETDLKIPVITSTQASFWASLGRCRVTYNSGYGRLFKC